MISKSVSLTAKYFYVRCSSDFSLKFTNGASMPMLRGFYCFLTSDLLENQTNYNLTVECSDNNATLWTLSNDTLIMSVGDMNDNVLESLGSISSSVDKLNSIFDSGIHTKDSSGDYLGSVTLAPGQSYNFRRMIHNKVFFLPLSNGLQVVGYDGFLRLQDVMNKGSAYPFIRTDQNSYSQYTFVAPETYTLFMDLVDSSGVSIVPSEITISDVFSLNNHNNRLYTYRQKSLESYNKLNLSFSYQNYTVGDITFPLFKGEALTANVMDSIKIMVMNSGGYEYTPGCLSWDFKFLVGCTITRASS